MNKNNNFAINSRLIGESTPPYCIAEVGINHNGDISVAKKMIRVAKEAGADAVKFQTFTASEFCGDGDQLFTYISQGQSVTEKMLDMFKRYELPKNAWIEIKKCCDEEGITFISTPQNISDLELLLEVGLSAIKVGSDDLTNIPLLKAFSEKKIPLILSCGMSDIAEVHQALHAVNWYNTHCELVLLLCTSQYPTPPDDVNLNKLGTLQQAFPGLMLGFSDHTQGPLAASLAVAFGANVFEKHFTLDNEMSGPDHWFSENPANLKIWVESIHRASVMLGSPYLLPTVEEEKMRKLARRSVVAIRSIKSGERLSPDNIGLRRPGNGLNPVLFNQIIGKRAAKGMPAGYLVQLGDFEN